MNRPWPRMSCQAAPPLATSSPTATIAAPNATVQRTPMRSAIRPMAMPPTAMPTQASE